MMKSILILVVTFLATLGRADAQCGCSTCGDDSSDPTFVEPDARQPKALEKQRTVHLKALAVFEAEIHRIAAMQLSETSLKKLAVSSAGGVGQPALPQKQDTVTKEKELTPFRKRGSSSSK